MGDEDDLEDRLRKFFGETIYAYTDAQAIRDGILLPYIAGKRDTGHRITSNAYAVLKQHYQARGYADYTDEQFHQFFFAELLPLVPEAIRRYQHGDLLKTTYDFQVTNRTHDVLWHLPNEVHGVTTMLPEDY